MCTPYDYEEEDYEIIHEKCLQQYLAHSKWK